MGKTRPQNKYCLIEIAEKTFFVLFSLYAALSTCSLTFGTVIISVVMWLSFMLGLTLFIYRVINIKSYIKMPFCLLMILLLASLVISTLANYQYEFKRNVVSCIYWLFFFFVLYVIKQDASDEKIKKDFHFIAAVFTVLITICVILSFVVFVCGYKKTIEVKNDFTYYIGFKIGRLWGVFLNLNRGAVSAGISSVLLIYFIKSVKKIWFRIAAVFAIFLNLLYIALADSRSGALCFGLCSGFLVLFLLVYKFKDRKFWYKLLAVLCACFTFAAGYFLPRQMKNGYNKLVPMIYNGIRFSAGSVEDVDEADKNNLLLVERGYDLSDDISNRRFDVWKSGTEIMLNSTKNIIIGTSFNGMLPYAKDRLPETYIVNNDFDTIGTMDNDFFNLLVAQGILGVILLIILAVSVLVLIFKNFTLSKKENAFELSIMLAVLFSIAACSMFTSLVFYYFSQNAVLFWSFLGMSVFLLKPKKENLENE